MLKEYLNYKLETKRSLGTFKAEFVNNKLVNLNLAQIIGLKVPKTIVTTNKEAMLEFANSNSKIITKSIGDVNFSANSSQFQGNGTQLVDKLQIQKQEDKFFPTIVQEFISKQFEVRVFFFKKRMYSMAIFSQKDEMTKVDYRNYNPFNENRNVPFLLPKDIEEKLLLFMKSANLDTGSIDLIVTPDNKYYFLEVNPVGQFDWLSVNCNYYIEKDIASFLDQD